MFSYKFDVGDKVRLVKNNSSGGDKVGDILTIKLQVNGYYRCGAWYYTENELEAVSDIKVGDTVKIVKEYASCTKELTGTTFVVQRVEYDAVFDWPDIPQGYEAWKTIRICSKDYCYPRWVLEKVEEKSSWEDLPDHLKNAVEHLME